MKFTTFVSIIGMVTAFSYNALHAELSSEMLKLETRYTDINRKIPIFAVSVTALDSIKDLLPPELFTAANAVKIAPEHPKEITFEGIPLTIAIQDGIITFQAIEKNNTPSPCPVPVSGNIIGSGCVSHSSTQGDPTQAEIEYVSILMARGILFKKTTSTDNPTNVNIITQATPSNALGCDMELIAVCMEYLLDPDTAFIPAGRQKAADTVRQIKIGSLIESIGTNGILTRDQVTTWQKTMTAESDRLVQKSKNSEGLVIFNPDSKMFILTSPPSQRNR